MVYSLYYINYTQNSCRQWHSAGEGTNYGCVKRYIIMIVMGVNESQNYTHLYKGSFIVYPVVCKK